MRALTVGPRAVYRVPGVSRARRRAGRTSAQGVLDRQMGEEHDSRR